MSQRKNTRYKRGIDCPHLAFFYFALPLVDTQFILYLSVEYFAATAWTSAGGAGVAWLPLDFEIC